MIILDQILCHMVANVRVIIFKKKLYNQGAPMSPTDRRLTI